MKSNLLLSIISFCVLSFLYSCTKTSSTTGTKGWTALGGSGSAGSLNVNGAIYAMTIDKAGNVYVAGEFTDVNGRAYVAKWNGSSWSELGNGFNTSNNNTIISSLAVDPSGNIYATGNFKDSNNYYYVAKWDGINWVQLGHNYNVYISSLNCDLSGNLYAGHYYGSPSPPRNSIAKWDGKSWMELSGTKLLVATNNRSIAFDALGNIYVTGGVYPGNTIGVCKWNGSDWSRLTNGSFVPKDIGSPLISNSSNNLFTIGTNINGKYYVTKWDGFNWNLLDNGYVPLNANNYIDALAIDPSGNIYAAGAFTNALGYNYIAKWDGKNWNELTLGVKNAPLNANGEIKCLAIDASGNIYAAGAFTDDHGYAYVAKFTK